MEGGDGMIAMVRGCGPAGLSVTLFDGGRKYTLMPNQTVNLNTSNQQPCSHDVATTQPLVIRNPATIHQQTTNPQMINTQIINPPIHQVVKPQMMSQPVRYQPQAALPDNMDRQNSHHSTMTNTDQDKRDISAQVTDGRYTTVYKMLHCNASPTSPPAQVTEFPPQRHTLVPGHGNFEVGGGGSSQKQYTAKQMENTYHGAMVWSDRGAVYSRRSSRQLDSFASSLRKYPSLSPDKCTDTMERLVNYSKNLKQKLASNAIPHHPQNQGTEASPRTLRDQLRYEECRRLEHDLSAIKEDDFRPEYEYSKGRNYARYPDVRFMKEANKFGSTTPCKGNVKNKDYSVNAKSMYNENQAGSIQERVCKKDTLSQRFPMTLDNLAVSPSPTSSQHSNATPTAQNTNSFSTAMENLNNSISIQTLYTPYTALRQKKSVGTTLSSIEFSKCSCKVDLRKTKSEEDISDKDVETKLCRWFNSIDEDLDGKVLKAKTVLKLKKNISEWGECLKKGIQHVICFKDDTWCSDSDNSVLPVRNKNQGDDDTDIEEVIGHLLDKINNSKEVQAQNLHRETIAKLGLKLKEIVLKCKRKKQQSMKDDLLNALYELPLDISHTTKKVYLEDLVNSLTEKMKNVAKCTSNVQVLKPKLTGTVPIRNSVNKRVDNPNMRSETFVVLPSQLVKATNFPSIVKKPSNHAIMNTTPDDIKANLVIYIRQLSAKVYEWLECIKNEIPHIEEAKLADAVKHLAEDIVDRLKYRELSAIQSITTSNENDLENLKYQIFKWINKYVGEDNLTTLRRAPDLMQKIKTVPIPQVLQRSQILQYDEDSDSSNFMIKERSNKKDLLEKVSDVLPIFKNITKTDKANARPADVKLNLLVGKSELKKCNTFVKDPSQSLTNSARYMNIANMSTGQTSRRCKQSEPVPAPDTQINLINDEYFEYLDTWLKRIPIPYSSESDRELANRARMGISNAFLHSLYSLSLDPAKLSNRFYYEDILEDVLDDLLNELPQIPELVRIKPVLKAQLIDKTISTYELMYKIRDKVSYQQQFVHTVLAMIPHRRRSHERLSDELEICSFVDEYILSVRYQNDDPDRSKWHRDRAFKKIENFVEGLHRYGKIGEDKSRWTWEILQALDNIPAPCDEILREEVDRIKLEEEIDDWYLSLPVIDNEEVYERIRRKNLKAALVKKIFDMDRELNLGDCAGQRELKYEISRFIEKLPLKEDGNLNMNILINTLLTKLKTRNRQREYEHHSRKSVSFDDVFPLPPCCLQNQEHHSSKINHQYDHTFGSPNAFMDETVRYSQFHQNVPKSSSYNEQNADDMKFYSLDVTQMPPDMKQTVNSTRNSVTAQGNFNYYSFQEPGQTSVKQMPRQNTSGSPSTSHQSYQVPHQYCISKSPKIWRGNLHTSQVAGPSGVNRPNQATYSNFDAAGKGQKTCNYKTPATMNSQVPGTPVSRMQQNSPNSNEYTLDSSITSYFKPSGPPCCEKPFSFKPKGVNSGKGPSEMPMPQKFDAAPVTHSPTGPQTPFQYSKKAGVSQISALSGSVGSMSGSLSPNSILEDARVLGVQRCYNQPPKFNQSSLSGTAQQPQRCQVSYTKPKQKSSSKTPGAPCHVPVQLSSQLVSSSQIPQPATSQMNQSIIPQMHQSLTSQSQRQPSMASQVPQQSSQHGSNIDITSSGRSKCYPWCTTCTNQPHNKRCKNNKSCLMPGCDNPNCKVPKGKRRKIQQLQLQLQRMYESGGVLEGTESIPCMECTTNAIVNPSYKCRCMEFYIKKCKKARKCTYPFSNCTDVLDIPPCLAFRAPHPCFL